MKHFRLARITERDHRYHAFLTWDKSFEFTRKRYAQDFLCTTNKFLTALLVELNDHLCDITVRYRRNWILFFHDKPSHSGSNYADERKCKRSLHDVEDLLDVGFNHHRFINGSVGAFENLKRSTDFLIDVCRVLLKYYRRRSETYDIWQINLLISKLKARKQELEDWGIEAAAKMQVKMHVAVQGEIQLQFSHKISAVA